MKDFSALVYQNLNIKLNETQISQFDTYYNYLIEFNSHTNLTRIAPDDVALLHFYDSLSAVKFVDFNKYNTLLDIGTGAGFPGVPLKIIFPHLKLTLVDSRKKKIGFLEELSAKLSLDDVCCMHARAEDLSKNKKYQNSFDLVTARAVADIRELINLLLPFGKNNGKFILYKGPKAADELSKAKNQILKNKLIIQTNAFELPESGQSRLIITISR